MDLARRIRRIVADNRGTLIFLKAAKPTTGWVTVQRVAAYVLSEMTADQTTEAIRSFLVGNLTVSDGVAVYRRSGVLTLARITLFATEAEALSAARAGSFAHVINVADNSVIQVGDFLPDVPGDNLPD